MHNPVTDRDKVDVLRLAQPRSRDMNGRGEIRNLVRRKHPVDRGGPIDHSRT